MLQNKAKTEPPARFNEDGRNFRGRPVNMGMSFSDLKTLSKENISRTKQFDFGFGGPRTSTYHPLNRRMWVLPITCDDSNQENGFAFILKSRMKDMIKVLCRKNEHQKPSNGERDKVMIKTFLATLAFLLFTTTGWATAYYVDSKKGDDANKGTTTSTAWKTINKVNTSTFNPGDRVLFLRDKKFNDKSLIIPSSGTLGNHIVFGAYGNVKEKKPVIDAKKRNFAIKINKDYITIQDLEIKGWTQRGIFGQDSSHISILRNTISGGNDVEPSHGIQFKSGTLRPGIIIKSNTIKKIGIEDKNTRFGFNGIMLQGVTGCEVRFNDIKTKNVNAIRLQKGSGIYLNDGCWIGGNYITKSEGGIVVNGSVSTKVWSNVIRDNAAGIAVGFGSDFASVIDNDLENLSQAFATWGFPSPVPWMWNGIDINGAANGVANNNRCNGVWNHCLMLDNDGQDSNGWTFTNNVLDARESTGTKLCLRIEGDVNGDVAYTSDFNTCYTAGNVSVDYKDRFNPMDWADYQAATCAEGTCKDINSQEF